MKVNPRILSIKKLYQNRTVSPNIVVPQIILSGVWLQKAGFNSSESVLVSVKRNKLIIEKDRGQIIKGDIRRIKISYAYVQREKGYKKVPKIVLSGLWLKAANFNCTEKIQVDVTTKGITIEKPSIKSSEAVLMHLYQAPHNIFTMHEYPAFIC